MMIVFNMSAIGTKGRQSPIRMAMFTRPINNRRTDWSLADRPNGNHSTIHRTTNATIYSDSDSADIESVVLEHHLPSLELVLLSREKVKCPETTRDTFGQAEGKAANGQIFLIPLVNFVSLVTPIKCTSWVDEANAIRHRHLILQSHPRSSVYFCPSPYQHRYKRPVKCSGIPQNSNCP